MIKIPKTANPLKTSMESILLTGADGAKVFLWRFVAMSGKNVNQGVSDDMIWHIQDNINIE